MLGLDATLDRVHVSVLRETVRMMPGFQVGGRTEAVHGLEAGSLRHTDLGTKSGYSGCKLRIKITPVELGALGEDNVT